MPVFENKYCSVYFRQGPSKIVIIIEIIISNNSRSGVLRIPEPAVRVRFDPPRKCVWLALEFMDGGVLPA